MKKRKEVTINIHLTNRWLYTLIIIGIIIVIGAGIYAYGGGSGSPSVFGHTINETAPPSPCYANQFLKWDGTKWICTTSGSGYYINNSCCYTGGAMPGSPRLTNSSMCRIASGTLPLICVARCGGPGGNPSMPAGYCPNVQFTSSG
jgi:hypothetical protein